MPLHRSSSRRETQRDLSMDAFGIMGTADTRSWTVCWRSLRNPSPRHGDESCDTLGLRSGLDPGRWVSDPLLDYVVTPGCELYDTLWALRAAAELGGDFSELWGRMVRLTEEALHAGL